MTLNSDWKIKSKIIAHLSPNLRNIDEVSKHGEGEKNSVRTRIFTEFCDDLNICHNSKSIKPKPTGSVSVKSKQGRKLNSKRSFMN